MAWSYGRVRWTLPFESRGGVSCRVDIYMRDYVGTATKLQGDKTPVYWDEDDSDNLLEVIRTKSGYINIVEDTFNEFGGIIPAVSIDRYVEVVYNDVVVFSGFINAQSFDLPYVSGPNVRKFPIISPLEVVSSLHFQACTTPAFKSLGAVLKEACNIVPANIEKVIFPTGISLGNNITADLTWVIHSLVYSPFNESFDHYKTHDQDLYAPITVESFIKGLCNCFGLMVHDYPGMLVFTKVDYSGTYGVFDVDALDESVPTPTATYDSSVLNDYNNIPILSNSGSVKNILPISKLEIEYEGEFNKDAELTFDLAKYWYWNYTDSGQLEIFITMKNMDPAIVSTYWNEGLFPVTDLVPPPYGEDWKRGVWMAYFGDDGVDSLEEKILYRPKTDAMYAPIFEWTVWQVSFDENGFTFNMLVERSTQGAITLEKAESIRMRMQFCMENGGMKYYYNGTDWSSTSASTYVIVTTDEKGKVIYALNSPDFYGKITVKLYPEGGDIRSDTYIYGFSRISLSAGSKSVFNVVLPQPETYKRITNDNGSFTTASISQLFNVAIPNQNQVMPASCMRTQVGIPTEYGYLFQSRVNITLDTMLDITPYVYLHKIKFMTEYPRKKLIACSFTPSEDTMQITMQGITNM